MNNGFSDALFAGRRITVLGLGIEGVSLVRYLAHHGAEVTVGDAKPAAQLQERLAAIKGLPVRLLLESNEPPLVRDAELVFVSQGVPLDIPAVQAARERGIPISSVTQLFLQRWRGPIVAVTGSSGKTTTTSLIAAMFQAGGRRHILAGNIGQWPLERLDEPNEDTWAVLEISHTQLQLVDRSPYIACITNIMPNHLDRFRWDEYVALKRNLIRYQRPGDWAVLNYDNPECWSAREVTAGQILAFSRQRLPEGEAAYIEAAYIVDGLARLRLNGVQTVLFPVTEMRLRGVHNLENCLAAAAAAYLAGIDVPAIRHVVQTFTGVPHRLEFVAEVAGVAYYNDSIATTPERTLAGMRSFEEPLVLLLGGREKHLPLAELAQECHRRCRAVVVFGEAAALLEAALHAHQPAGGSSLIVRRSRTLEQAVAEVHQLALPGDVALLSPACTSFDAYANFEERGAHFRALVAAMMQQETRKERA